MTRSQRTDLNCPRCGLIVTTSERRSGDHICARRADPEVAATYAAAARTAAKDAARPKETAT